MNDEDYWNELKKSAGKLLPERSPEQAIKDLRQYGLPALDRFFMNPEHVEHFQNVVCFRRK